MRRILRSMMMAVAITMIPSVVDAAGDSDRHRIFVSTDIGGTDPDDNQSMTHLMMYSDMFDIEGIVSTPSFGSGSKEEILRMISVYEKDYPRLKSHAPGLLSPDSLRSLCSQGTREGAPWQGFSTATDGSRMLVECARRDDSRPLYVLVWGALEDVAQALHDAPDIKDRIRVYWIGGPNKKWGVNAYAYIAENFPDLWMIENNASYRGFISNNKRTGHFNNGYYDAVMKNTGHLGPDFKAYYDGNVKMGDSPSLFYMMNGDPSDPESDSWGGRFEKTAQSPRTVFHRMTTGSDTVAVYSVIELRLKGPENVVAPGEKCFTLTIDRQDWDGIYAGNGEYAVRYSPKAPATLAYRISSPVKELDGLEGSVVVGKVWPGNATADSYRLGDTWWTDCSDPDLYGGPWQGFKTVEQWREDVLADWEKRWSWLK
ncbi:MAG: DUF1593 domain-containing protein [Bacteroides sp.]|nr:DUF1593 domain-containing protein [Bacteroides sp.]